MRKSIWIFLLAVILPSVVLGWLALGSAEEQKIILEQRTAALYQSEVDNVASAARLAIEEERRAFTEAVRAMLAKGDPNQLATTFTQSLPEHWPRQAIGFVIGADGRILAPSPASTTQNDDLKGFLIDNGAFLSGSLAATVYPVPVDELNRAESGRRNKLGYISNSQSRLNGRTAEYDKVKSPSAEPAAGFKDSDVPPANAAAAPADAPTTAASAPSPTFAATSKSMGPAPAKPEAKRAGGDRSGSVAVRRDTPLQEDEPLAAQGLTRGTASKSRDAIETRDAIKSTLDAREQGLKAKEGKSDESKVAELAAEAAPVRPPAPAESKTLAKDALGWGGKLEESAPPALKERQMFEANASKDGADDENQSATLRSVVPQQLAAVPAQAPASNLSWANTDFSALVRDSGEGMVTRYVQDQLDMIFWVRPPQAPNLIFGCLIKATNLNDVWTATMPGLDEWAASSSVRAASNPRTAGSSEFILALLDDKAHPVATQPAGTASRDWKHPFVAAEIGEALPHWEAALYLRDPAQLQKSARSVQRTLLLLIVSMLGAIACGGWLVVHDARRQMLLAQQKTDFVSNVSHELKTPLTSIRMFAELMQGGRPETAAKAPQYLRIIMVEAERLTRLINNVLDFAKIERRQRRLNKKPIDLHEVVERTWEALELHLQSSGFSTKATIAPGPYPVFADEDALAQILVNLLSNAEKYAGDRREVELQAYIDSGSAFVSILDRGLGVAPGEEKKIFEAFYRAHDSLSSGIQGSGLGLTLAQRLALDHDGEILHETRQDGGSRFTLRIPLQNPDEPPSHA